MSTHYVDASTWAKLIVAEPESARLADFVETARDEGDVFVSSQLLATELHRLGVRVNLERAAVETALDQVALILPDPATYRLAGLLPGATLHSLDAVHIATALDAEADTFLSYDDRQRQGAERAGLTTAAPGSPDS